MFQSSLAFAFPSDLEPPVLSAARALAERIQTGEGTHRQALNRLLTEHFGGKDAEGRWSVRDAHAAIEFAQVLWLKDHSALTPRSVPGEALATFDRLDALLPSQTVRSEEQIALQQFLTPLRLAWLAARACALRANELMLEPSAGTGMLGVWGASVGARLALSEISPLRRDCLAALFPAARVTGHDGELIDELLDPALAPSAILINPPYSHGLERRRDGQTGSRHLRSAWLRLAPQGRLVAVMPEWVDLAAFRTTARGSKSVRLNAVIECAFANRGTWITTRLIVLDKAEGGDLPKVLKPVDYEELTFLVDLMSDRSEHAAAGTAPSRTAMPLRLVTRSRQPVPLPARPASPAGPILPIAYQPLPAPAPIAEQVGNYLPYRPSRIVISGAADHPTALVESVAVGSISAPIPDVVSQLPAGLIEKRVLSAAQLEP